MDDNQLNPVSESIGDPLKSIDHGLYGTHYIEYIRIHFEPYRSYFYRSLDYNLSGVVQITNEGQLFEYLDAYFRHEHLYGKDAVTSRIEEVIDEYLLNYLNSVPSNVRKLKGKQEFITYEDIKPHPQDWAISIIENPDISDYYEGNKSLIRNNAKQDIIDEATEQYVEEVVDWFITKIEENIANRVEVIWEVPHTIYKSTSPIADADIKNKTISPLVVLSKYESEYKDYDIKFNQRYFYKIVEHLPSGDVILAGEWDQHFGEGEQVQNYWDESKSSIIPHEGKNIEFFVPYPYIATAPSCRRNPSMYYTKYEGRFNNTTPEGGYTYRCPPFMSPPPRPHIIHPITVYRRDRHVRVLASTHVHTLSDKVERAVDLRNFEPPKIVETDEWYTEEYFGEYPSLKTRKEEKWWKDYRDANISSPSEWHEFWNDRIHMDKEDLVWYINTYIDDNRTDK